MSHFSADRFSARLGRLPSRLRKAGAGVAFVAAGVLGLSALPTGASPPSQAATSAVAANQAATSPVALAINSAGTGFGFYRGQGDVTYMRPFTNGAWSAQSSVPGVIIGAPAASFTNDSTVVLAARGTDSALWVRKMSLGTWGAWQRWGGALSSSPAITGTSDGRIDAFVRGADRALWTKTMTQDGVLTPWRRLGGGLSTAPSAAASAPGQIEVYVAGIDHRVWYMSLQNGTWSGWKTIGGKTYSAPAVSYFAQSTNVAAFARGTNNNLYENVRTGLTWSGWRNLGGWVIDSPTAAGTPAPVPTIDIAVRSTDRAVYTKQYRGGAWSGYSRGWVPADPAPPATSLLGKDWTRIPTTSKVVALTFDAGANAAGVPSIESTLRTKNVRATFFLTGTWARTFPAEANLIAAGGFLFGNHSMTHPDFTTLTDAQVTAQVEDAQQAILTSNGADPRPLFRFPFGAVNTRVLTDVNNLGYVSVRWTVDSLGWEGTSGGQTVQKVIDRVLAAVQPGEIVLMHLGSNPTDNTTLDASALPSIIDGIRARGYTFVTLRALTG